MNKILLIIDIQEGFITTPSLVDVKNNIENLIEKDCFDYVISTIYQNYENSPIIKLMGWDKLLDEKEQELLGKIKTKSDFKIKKNKYSGVTEELLNILLKINNNKLPEVVYLAGVDTECCVLSTAIDLFEIGIRPIVLSNYCGSSSGLSYHNAGVLSMHNLIGYCNICDELVEDALTLENAYNNAINLTNNKNINYGDIEKLVVKKLIEKNLFISFAESCTGGLLSSSIINVSDASKVIKSSFVTYSDESKIDLLNVKKETIDNFGVVSEEVAKEMAIGAASKSNSDIGVSVTGIAGPTGGSEKLPVGTVSFGVYYNKQVNTYTQYFGNIGRNNVRNQAVKFVFEKILELL